MRLLKMLWLTALGLMPLLVFVVGLPLSAKVKDHDYEVYTAAVLYVFLVLALAGNRFAPRFERSKVLIVCFSVFVLCAPVAAWRLDLILPGSRVLVSLCVMGALFFAWGVCGKARKIPAPAIMSLLIALAGLTVLERFLDALPSRILAPEVIRIPPLAPADRGNHFYRKNGFRGDRPCIDCTERGLRIFTIGGSSTYGTPMFYPHDNYSARLENLLRERRPGENWEVYNAGIPGYGMMQIQDSIEKEIVRYKPDMIMICAWFNDNASIPGWYGFHGRSDKESHELVDLLRKIERSWVYRRMESTRIYGVFRLMTLRAKSKLAAYLKLKQGKKGRRRQRMSPEEFRWGLERILELSEQHGFLPIIVTEAVNRTPEFKTAVKRNRYYQVMREFARANEIPLVNTLDALAERRDEWLFYDFIHPNQAGHQIIAETLFDFLLAGDPHPRLKPIYAGHGIDYKRPALRREYNFQLRRGDLEQKEITLEARLANSGGAEYALELSVGGEISMIQTGLHNEFSPFIFKLDSAALRRPLVDLIVRARSFDSFENPGGSRQESPYIEVRRIAGH